jgi:hypothetical protein
VSTGQGKTGQDAGQGRVKSSYPANILQILTSNFQPFIFKNSFFWVFESQKLKIDCREFIFLEELST